MELVDAIMKQAFRLNPALDATMLTDRFHRNGSVRIPDFLDGDGADRLRGELMARTDWQQVINSGDRTVELDRPTRETMSDATRADLDNSVYAGARYGFQFRYETLRVPDDRAERAARGDLLAAFVRFMSDGAGAELMRAIAGEPAITFADGQATAYSPGDFLTGHDDHIPEKSRVAAYVFGLNPVWRTEWGGLLLMHGQDGSVRGMTPAFGSLDLFRVGQMHSVSEVTRAAAYRRYSVTGWLRLRDR